MEARRVWDTEELGEMTELAHETGKLWLEMLLTW